MERVYIEEKSFARIDFTGIPLPKGDYEHCVYTNCNFSGTDLSGISFSECEFTGCNLSMARLNKTAFKDITFKACKLLGLHFEECDDFLISFAFEDCNLNLSSFYKLKIKKTLFRNSSLHEIDLTETNLNNSVFDNCDLAKARFDHTILEGVDLRTSYNYSIDPEINSIKKAKFSMAGIIGLLDKYDIKIE